MRQIRRKGRDRDTERQRGRQREQRGGHRDGRTEMES